MQALQMVVIQGASFRQASTRRSLIIWVMMNPSTADHSKNDPTICKVMNYSRDWGFTDLLVLNIYAIRSTDQQAKISGTGWVQKRLVVVHYLFLREDVQKVTGHLRLGKKP
jgi:hypothetical protein